MKYGVLLGSNLFIDTYGTLDWVDDNGKRHQFFKIKEIWRQRSDGSYLALDVDVKDNDGKREIKLYNSKPVVEGDVVCERTETSITVRRQDGSIVLKVEQLEPNDVKLKDSKLVTEALRQTGLDAVIKIEGDFTILGVKVIINDMTISIGGISMSGNLIMGTRSGITMSKGGLSLG